MCSKINKNLLIFCLIYKWKRVAYPLLPKSVRKILMTSLARFLGSAPYLTISAIHLSISREYICRTPHVLAFQQRAKKVVSDSPGLVDFAIGLVNSVLNLPDGQVKFFYEFLLQKNGEINSAHQKVSGASSNDVWASKCYLQLARMASCKTAFLCSLLSSLQMGHPKKVQCNLELKPTFPFSLQFKYKA